MTRIDMDDEFDTEVTGASARRREQEHEGQLTVDVFQDDGDIVVRSTIAGAKGNDIDISITKDTVTIRGQRTPEYRIQTANFFYRELYWGPFSRTIILPADIDPDNAKASMKNGILTIRMPRLDKVRTKKIRIME